MYYYLLLVVPINYHEILPIVVFRCVLFDQSLDLIELKVVCFTFSNGSLFPELDFGVEQRYTPRRQARSPCVHTRLLSLGNQNPCHTSCKGTSEPVVKSEKAQEQHTGQTANYNSKQVAYLSDAHAERGLT